MNPFESMQALADLWGSKGWGPDNGIPAYPP